MRVAAVLVAALAFAGIASAGPQDRPVLRMTGDAPTLTLTGARFHPNESVVVLITGTKFARRALKANADGGFQLRVTTGYGKCQSLTIAARGSMGGRAFAGILSTGCDRGGLPSMQGPHFKATTGS